ncbi:MAG: hypothetical protein AAFR07_05790 [Pseudomonadota bacterium]
MSTTFLPPGSAIMLEADETIEDIWLVKVAGPDYVHTCDSKAEAFRLANAINRATSHCNRTTIANYQDHVLCTAYVENAARVRKGKDSAQKQAQSESGNIQGGLSD